MGVPGATISLRRGLYVCTSLESRLNEMIGKFRNWLKSRRTPEERPLPIGSQRKPAQTFARPKKATSSIANKVAQQSSKAKQDYRIESAGPGKNVLMRSKYVREDTGTHETLKILDDSLIETGEETGIDPYNTGAFDRSQNWTKRFRK